MIDGRSLIYRLGEPWEVCAAKPWGTTWHLPVVLESGDWGANGFVHDMTILPL